MFDEMAWTDEPSDAGAPPSWEMELMRMRYAEGAPPTAPMDRNGLPSSIPPVNEPMELSPDPFYLNNGTTTTPNMGVQASLQTHHQQPPVITQTQQPTLTSSASCPSFASFYDIDGDDLLRDIPDGEPLGGEPLMGNMGFGNPMGMGGQAMGMGGGYDYVLQFQQQHQNANMRQFPHQSAAMNTNNHMALLQQSRRQLHMSASFTSLSSMETEYRRHLATKRKKAVAERWNKVQRHKSFDSTTSSVATAPSPATSMEFSNFNSTSTFESTPETHYMDEMAAPRRTSEAEMIGFSIDDFPTTFTSDASWPMPPPLSLGSEAPFDGYGDASSQQMPPSSAYESPVHTPEHLSSPPTTVPEMDQLLLSDQERANVSSLLDAIRDFDSPLPTHPEDRASVPEVKRSSPTLRGKPRHGGAQQHRSSRSPQLRGIARHDSGKRKENITTKPAVLPPSEETPIPTIRDRIQRVLEKSSSSVNLLDEERKYLDESPQFSREKAGETAGSLWLLIHSSKCVDASCSIAGCDVMRRVVRHCRGCDAPLGKCRDPCNDAKAMLLHHATCKQANISAEAEESKEPTCALCSKMHEIDRAHNALKARPPLSPQLKATPSPQLMPMTMPPMAMPMPMSSPLGGPILIAPQPLFKSPTLKPAPPSGSAFKPIQPNPLPTASNPMGMIGSFPHFGVSLALYLEQTSPPFRAEVKARVEKRVTTAAGQDLIQHMQKKTRLRSLEDLRSEARAIVLGEMERELHLHMQALNWATVANNSAASGETGGQGDSGLPAYLLSVAAAGFAAFYTQQATIQAAALAGVPPPFSLSAASTPRQPLSRQSSSGSLTSSASSSSLATVPLAPKKNGDRQSSPLTRTDSDKGKETALAV